MPGHPTHVPPPPNPIPPLTHPADPRHLLSAVTLGGIGAQGHAGRHVCLLRVADYLQQDQSYNATLWSFLPPVHSLEVCDNLHYEEEEEEMNVPSLEAYAADPAAFNLEKLVSRHERNIPLGELHNLYLMSQAIEETSDVKVDDIEQVLNARKRQLIVPEMTILMELLTTLKEKGNSHYAKGDTLQALKTYHKALLSIYPWVNSSNLFKPNEIEAFSLMKLHGALWCNIIVVARKHAKQANKPIFAIHALEIVSTLIKTRYVTRHTLLKACTHGAAIHREALKNSLELSKAPHSPACTLGDIRVESAKIAWQFDLLARCVKTSGDMEGWAHEECLTEHSGCGCGSAAVAEILAGE